MVVRGLGAVSRDVELRLHFSSMSARPPIDVSSKPVSDSVPRNWDRYSTARTRAASALTRIISRGMDSSGLARRKRSHLLNHAGYVGRGRTNPPTPGTVERWRGGGNPLLLGFLP